MDTDAQVRDAILAFERRDHNGVVKALEALVRFRTPLSTTWGPLSRMAGAIGEASLSIACARLHLEQAPSDLHRQLELASTLATFDRIDEAISIGRQALARHPNSAPANHNLGISLVQSGANQEAELLFRRSLALQPRSSPSWISLSQLFKFSPQSPELAALREAAARSTDAALPVRGSIYYALGKAMEDCGDVQEAFSAYTVGADLIRRELPFEENEGPRFVSELRDGFDAQFLSQLTPSCIESNRVVFVLGLPRSGTTLVEQILCAHSGVAQGAELGLFRHAAMALERFAPREILEFQRRSQEPQTIWRSVGETYLRLVADRFGQNGKVVDKSLSTPYQLGVIAHVLPNARFIWLKREVGAVAWSCFRTRFASGQNWSWSLPDIAAHFRVNEALHRFWTEQYEDRILTVPYEELVNDPDAWIPRVLSHAGLQDELATRKFHETRRVVHTASAAQVHRPLYRGANEAWRRFETHMAPFFEAFAAVGELDQKKAAG